MPTLSVSIHHVQCNRRDIPASIHRSVSNHSKVRTARRSGPSRSLPSGPSGPDARRRGRTQLRGVPRVVVHLPIPVLACSNGLSGDPGQGRCTTCPSGRSTPFFLGRSAFPADVPRVPPHSGRLHMCAKDAFRPVVQPVRALIPHAHISTLYLVVQVVQGVYKARLTRANACTTCKSPRGTPRLEKS
jgi:hypothetical protein